MFIGPQRRAGIWIALPCSAACCLLCLGLWFSADSAVRPDTRGRPSAFFVSAGRPDTVERYHRALGLMGAKRDREAVALLADLRRRPLDAPLDARPGANVPHDITPSALMIRLCAALCDRARAAARDGDGAAATGWTREARALATHVLASSAPTFDTLRAVRAMDQAIGRTAVRVEKETGSSGAAVRLAAREARLRAFYEECVWPDLVNARRERDAAQNAVLLSVAPGGAQEQARRRIDREMDAREPDLAAILRQRYLSARAVLLSPLPSPETHVVRRQGPRPTVRPRA